MTPLDLSTVDAVTDRKAAEVQNMRGGKVTGYVFTMEAGHRVIVERGSVLWVVAERQKLTHEAGQ